MSTFYDRLLEEKLQLDERVNKLLSFLESDKIDGINPVQISLLNIQITAMLSYQECLFQRILWLEAEEQESKTE